QSDTPSTPSRYWMPRLGTQADCSTNCRSGCPTWKPSTTTAAMAKSTSPAPSASQRTVEALSRGTNAIAIAPRIGTRIRSESSNSASGPHHVAEDHDHPGQDRQGVVPDEAGLDRAKLGADPAHRRGDPPDRAVDDPVVDRARERHRQHP